MTLQRALKAPPLEALPAEEVAPVLEAAAAHGGALAMLTAVNGRFARRIGTMMAISPQGQVTGALSGGCVDSDIAHHAVGVIACGQSKRLRYGQGSENWDIRLPCGSGIEVTLTPAPANLEPLLVDLHARRPVTLDLKDLPKLALRPRLRILAFGAGRYVRVLQELAEAAGLLCSPNPPDALARLDRHSAVALFFHDHEREDAILAAALQSEAFWIGAMGSRSAQADRLARMTALGLGAAARTRLHGPIGLIPQARSPEMLALSVLADIAAAPR